MLISLCDYTVLHFFPTRRSSDLAAPSSFYRRPVGPAAGLWWPRSGFVLALGVWLLLGAWGLVGVSLLVSGGGAEGVLVFWAKKNSLRSDIFIRPKRSEEHTSELQSRPHL